MEYRVDLTVRGLPAPLHEQLLTNLQREAPDAGPSLAGPISGEFLDVALAFDVGEHADALVLATTALKRALEGLPTIEIVTVFVQPEPAIISAAGDLARTIREVIDLLNQTRHTFKSKQVERARHLLEGLLPR